MKMELGKLRNRLVQRMSEIDNAVKSLRRERGEIEAFLQSYNKLVSSGLISRLQQEEPANLQENESSQVQTEDCDREERGENKERRCVCGVELPEDETEFPLCNECYAELANECGWYY